MNNILFIGGTHGHEPIGSTILKKISARRNDFDWIVGNPKALAQNTRFYETDLNRSAPGLKNSTVYEERRAAEIIERSKQYTYTIDLHGSQRNNGVFLIVTNITIENLRLASLFSIDKIVLWPSSAAKEQQGPMSEFFPCGIEIECGEKNDPNIYQKLEQKIVDFLDNYTDRELTDWKSELATRSIYKMYGSLKNSECKNKNDLKEFTPTTVGGEQFCPLFVGSYTYSDLLCYKLRQMSLEDVLATL